MTPPAILHALHRPADFVVSTQASLRYVLLKAEKNRAEKLSNALKFAIKFLANIQIGSLDFILPNGKKIFFKGKQTGIHAVFALHDEKLIGKFLMKGKLGFCEAYLDGLWSSPDMAKFFELMLQNEKYFQGLFMGKPWMRALEFIFHKLRPNSKEGSRKNIYDHYDIGNNFYKEWLDESMTYSSAYFADGITDLNAAQLRKYEEICRRLNLKAGMHILEIGCGWGGFAEYAAKNYHVKITGVTISNAQFEYATARIKNAGLTHLVELKIQDYRDIQGEFDGIVSIEMFEAVGEEYWPNYFETLNARLKKNGKAVLQIITINEKDFENYRNTADYIQKYIFPGGMLPPLSRLQALTASHGLKWNGLLSFGRDYARTLAIWNESFQKKWPRLQSARLNARFKRLWEQYFCYCQAGFETDTIDVVQITLDKAE